MNETFTHDIKENSYYNVNVVVIVLLSLLAYTIQVMKNNLFVNY
jgi:hypothetical protein